MRREREIAEEVEHLLEAPVAALGYRLLEVQFRQEGRWVLRLLIDREGGGISLDDCGEVSELAGRLLDVEDFIPQAYALEVSSPGVFRRLRHRKHFEQSVGRIARFTLARDALPERRQRTLRGTIEAVTDEAVTLDTPDERVTLPLAAIRSARLDPDL